MIDIENNKQEQQLEDDDDNENNNDLDLPKFDAENYQMLSQLALFTDRYDDMVKFVEYLAKQKKSLTITERNLISSAYKNLVCNNRAELQILTNSFQKLQNPLINKYKMKIQEQMIKYCSDILELLDKYLLTQPSQQSLENEVFFLKMTGDYFRYIIEVLPEYLKFELEQQNIVADEEGDSEIHKLINQKSNESNQFKKQLNDLPLESQIISPLKKQKSSQQKIINDYFVNNDTHIVYKIKKKDLYQYSLDRAQTAYKLAEKMAKDNLLPTNPVRLSLHLNHSIFYHENINNVEIAIKLANRAFEEAIYNMDKVSDEQLKDIGEILQLLKDNITLWQLEIQNNN